MMGRSTGWLGVLVMVGACTEAGGERPVSLCERYAEAAERVVGGWYEELELTVELRQAGRYEVVNPKAREGDEDGQPDP